MPTTLPVMACVVEIGMPSALAPNTTNDPAVDAQKPEWWLSLVSLLPIVLMIFHPPDMVPSAMAR